MKIRQLKKRGKRALKKTIQKYLDEHPRSDELDIAEGIDAGLMEVCHALGELHKAGRVRICPYCKKKNRKKKGR